MSAFRILTKPKDTRTNWVVVQLEDRLFPYCKTHFLNAWFTGESDGWLCPACKVFDSDDATQNDGFLLVGARAGLIRFYVNLWTLIPEEDIEVTLT